MSIEQIKSYLKENGSRYPEPALRAALISAGYRPEDIDAAFGGHIGDPSAVSPSRGYDLLDFSRGHVHAKRRYNVLDFAIGFISVPFLYLICFRIFDFLTPLSEYEAIPAGIILPLIAPIVLYRRRRHLARGMIAFLSLVALGVLVIYLLFIS